MVWYILYRLELKCIITSADIWYQFILQKYYQFCTCFITYTQLLILLTSSVCFFVKMLIFITIMNGSFSIFHFHL